MTTNDGRGWVPPDGLDRARPREVRLTSTGWSAAIGTVALLVLAVSAFIGLSREAQRQGRRRQEFLTRAVPATGRIVHLWRERGGKKHPWIRYTFTADGRTHEAQSRLNVSTWRSLRVGDPVPVRYLPSNPRVSFPLGRAPRALAGERAWLSGGLLAALAAPMAWGLSRQRHLLMEGRAALGHVTRHKRGPSTATWFFEFALLSGARREGHAVVATQQPNRAKLPEIGSSVVVLYDVDDHRRNAPYPLSLVRLARTDRLSGRAPARPRGPKVATSA